MPRHPDLRWERDRVFLKCRMHISDQLHHMLCCGSNNRSISGGVDRSIKRSTREEVSRLTISWLQESVEATSKYNVKFSRRRWSRPNMLEYQYQRSNVPYLIRS